MRIGGVVDSNQPWPLPERTVQWIAFCDAAKVERQVWKRNVSKRTDAPTHTTPFSEAQGSPRLPTKLQNHEAAANEGRGDNALLSCRCKRVVRNPPRSGSAPPWRRQNHFSLLIASIFFGDRTKAAG